MPFEEIVFTAAYGDEDSEVILTRMGGYWDISIDRYFKGCVVFWEGQWEVRPHKSEYFSLEDMQEISDRITDWEQPKKNNLK
jgi:hypothetical protein